MLCARKNKASRWPRVNRVTGARLVPGVEHGVTGGQLHATGAVDHGQLAVGSFSGHGTRHIGAHMPGATAIQRLEADGDIDKWLP